MPSYGNGMYGAPQPTNNLWVGNNYSSGYSQMNRSNYPSTSTNMMNNPMNVPQSMNNVLQVMGPESAQAFQLGPDSQVVLLDSGRPVFYMKKSDSSGYSETKAFSYQEIPLFPVAATPAIEEKPEEKNNYITKDEFEEFKKVIEELVMNNE